MNSEDGQRLLNNGIEGVNYTVEEGAAKYAPEQKDLTAHVQQAWLQLNMSVNGVKYLPKLPASDYEAATTDTIKKFAAEDLEKIALNPAAGGRRPRLTDIHHKCRAAGPDHQRRTHAVHRRRD
jgi:putative aldouronate transport system substrate-binding protein